MKNAKSAPKIKLGKDFSLPKLEAKIKNNVKLHDYQRLNFPRKDDTNYVRDVGRRHFLSNNSVSLQKIINPEFKQPIYHEFNDSNFKSVELKNLSDRLIENKINLASYHALTQLSEPPYARDYQTEKKITPRFQEKFSALGSDRQKIKTELSVAEPGKEKIGSLMQKSLMAAQIIDRKIDINFRASSKGKQGKESEDFPTRKIVSVPEELILDRHELRKFNPTFISSNF